MTPIIPTSEIKLCLDPTNPGHFFACCGLFELSSRIYKNITGYFSETGTEFFINTSNDTADFSLENLLQKIVNAKITALDANDATASPLSLCFDEFNIYIDWWKTAENDTAALKVWAGTMEVPRIACAMQKAMDISKREEILFDLKIAYDVNDTCKKVEPFYFDANRGPNADARDVGFAINDLELKTFAAPAVEFLCLVGLQRARPVPFRDRIFDYHLWTIPISISLVAAAINGIIQSQKQYAFRFESWFRTSQRKHKAFLQAKKISI